MLTITDFRTALDSLELGYKPAIAHTSLRSFGAVQGGAETVLDALLDSVSGLVMPTFTYKTMIFPEVGPPNNGLAYGTQLDLNRMAEPFRDDMSSDPLMGVLPEVLRYYPGAMRTAHPILSFAGIRLNDVLNNQTVYNPLSLIGALADQDGWALLLGVNHTGNTSIHYGEKLARRHQFVRWALMKKRIVACPNYPGCSDGFEDIRPEIKRITRYVQLGNSFIEAVPLQALLQIVEITLKRDPLALLCQRDSCARCDAVRAFYG